MSRPLAPNTVKRSLSAHAALGLIAGALLYVVSLTGTVAVFRLELQRLEQPHAPEMDSIDPTALQRGLEALLAREADKPKTTHVYVQLPVPEWPRAIITTDTTAVHLDSAGTIADDELNAWTEFLVQLHYTLKLPSLIGLTVVGVLGVLMLTLTVSGVVALPRIFRDAFRLRARSGGRLALADWHNRLSVWSLPFSIAIALTGALIGLASLTAYAIAATNYDGDLEKVYAPIYGAEGARDPSPAAAANLAAALEHMTLAYPTVRVTSAIVHDPLTKGQRVQIVGEHKHRLIFGEYYDFTGDGVFKRTAGLSDGSIGQQAAASTYRLHFGSFGGLAVKLAYVIFGLSLTVVCATGTYIWLGKREQKGMRQPALRAAWTGLVWGTPAALVLTFVARFVAGNDAPFTAIFWVSLLLAILTGVTRTMRSSAALIEGTQAIKPPSDVSAS